MEIKNLYGLLEQRKKDNDDSKKIVMISFTYYICCIDWRTS